MKMRLVRVGFGSKNGNKCLEMLENVLKSSPRPQAPHSGPQKALQAASSTPEPDSKA